MVAAAERMVAVMWADRMVVMMMVSMCMVVVLVISLVRKVFEFVLVHAIG